MHSDKNEADFYKTPNSGIRMGFDQWSSGKTDDKICREDDKKDEKKDEDSGLLRRIWPKVGNTKL